MLPVLGYLGIAVGIGLVLSWGVALRGISSAGHRVLLASLATAFGLGICACAYFAWLLAFGPRSVAPPLLELGLLTAVTVPVLLVRARRPSPAPRGTPGADHPAPRLLSRGAGLALACAGGAFVSLSMRNPHGGWDAWMTWNLLARFVFRGGEDWQVLFSDASPLRHPDYPFLLPSLVARSWSYAGAELLAAPIAIAFLFTAATVGVLGATLAILRTRSQGWLAVLVLASTPFFIVHGTSQYADVPIGLYFTVTLALLCLHDRYRASTQGFLLLAGLATGLAAWTKNEGLLFLVALPVARAIVVVPARGWRALWAELRVWAAGAAPVLLLVLYFRLWIAPANDLVSSSAQGVQATLGRLLDPERYLYILTSFARTLLEFGSNGLVAAGWLLLTYLICVGAEKERARLAGVRTAALTLVLMCVGYGVVYLTAPNDMERLLDGSVERVFLQLWPGFLLVFFMTARTLEEAGRSTAPAVALVDTANAHEIEQAV